MDRETIDKSVTLAKNSSVNDNEDCESCCCVHISTNVESNSLGKDGKNVIMTTTFKAIVSMKREKPKIVVFV